MGIRGLSKYFKNHIKNGISKIDIDSLNGKKIVIDTSIYMYRFNENNEMIENFYTLLLMFKFHDIIPLFIFDGITPKEKQETIKERQEAREDAQQKIDNLDTDLNIYSLRDLKRKRTRVSNKDRKLLRDLFDSCGVMYQYAPEEADSLCAQYVINGEAWACMSDDMDLFVYKCPRVIRYFSLVSKTAILYIFDEILNNMQISFESFQNICIMSGTDYNKTSHDIEYNMMLYNNNKLDNNIIPQYANIKSLYTVDHSKHINTISVKWKEREHIQSFLEQHNFVFIT